MSIIRYPIAGGPSGGGSLGDVDTAGAVVGDVLAVTQTGPLAVATTPPGGAFDRFGSNFNVGNTASAPTDAQLATTIDNMNAWFGPRPLLLVFHVKYDGPTLKIVQHGFTGTTHSEAKTDTAVNRLLGYGFPLFAIKLHQQDVTPEQITPQFWTDYAALVDQLAAKYQGQAQYCFITNEFQIATSDPANTTALESIITAVQGRGFKAGMSFVGLPEAARCVVIDDLDGVGVNVYPSVSSLGVNTTVEQVKEAWRDYGALEWFRQRQIEVPDQDRFVSEVGCTDGRGGLEYTGTGDFPGTNNGGQIVGRYWEGVLRLLVEEGDAVTAAFGWDQDGTFNPYQFAYSRAIMQRYAKAATL